jgi:hypothetical protein
MCVNCLLVCAGKLQTGYDEPLLPLVFSAATPTLSVHTLLVSHECGQKLDRKDTAYTSPRLSGDEEHK